jgi:predicted MFS family arabinose efflux permease
MAGSWGIILAGPPFTRLISSLGWRQSLGGITLLTLGLLACSVFFIREVPVQGNADGGPPSLGEALEKTKKVLLHKGSWSCFMAHFGIYGTYAAWWGSGLCRT